LVISAGVIFTETRKVCKSVTKRTERIQTI
jgi:hypothetical protein